ncbi:hypothetical protein BCR41DRAFT_300661 [Lobosporangium transversale]|uniref:SET domain-containing protein n=1 Tax=Lobosporangium transversale TaxID=64571 RepID=A0A1Y2GZ68_9FUNG|nr:hypothetical protein BCR41DRAFT_300661 [Lobosporangium transversale]ORZ27051.1 hypothetical protein BCR41DRAFT_300661 [Lobosporangium transversale]|eukprot:XP_021884798.1 hypothetical protein BCR41DRAFT_300661 [Lobosporangium transversale]
MTTSQRSLLKPRWHTQPYMMYLALRAMPNQTAARQELIMAAVELDKKFSAEKGLPRVFTGKTPMNSASACLTNNGDKYFIPFKPEGSRSTHFRLAYQPVDFESTLKAYNNWMEQLIKHDWPRCFGNPKEGIKKSQLENESIRTTRPEIQREEDGLTVATALNQEDNRKDSDRMHIHRLDIKAAGSYDGSTSCPPTPTAALAAATEKSLSLKEPFERASPIYRLEDLDLEGVPTDLADIVQVNVSMIPNAGNGLFAKIDVPAGTPLGFYFGVPMTENEFDSLKDGVGQALHYSLMYQRTVLDATDDHGQPYRDPRGRLFCPFHFMNDDSDGNVSFIAGSVVNQVICMTNRDVKAGEELLVYFGKEVIDRGSACLSPSPSSISTTASASTPASASVTAPAPAPALTIPGVATGSQGQEMTVQPDEDLDGKKSTKAAGSRSRASSPLKRIVPAEDTGRPRRESAYKPVRYTR